MRLLVFYPYVPYPLNRGTYHRTYHFLRELARLHDVDLLALDEDGRRLDYRNIFEEFCERVEFVPFQHPCWQKLLLRRLLNPLPTTIHHWRIEPLARALDQMLAAANYDAVHVCDVVLAQYFLREHRSIPIVVDRSRVDLQFQLMEHAQLELPLRERLLRWENYLKLWFFERRAASRCSLQIVCGPDDRDFIRRYVSSRVPIEIILNGVDTNYFSPGACEEMRSETPCVLFCGAMDYSPNTDAMRWYFREMHDPLKRLIPDVEVLIVGKNPSDEVRGYATHPGVTVTGSVPDVRPYYRRAWIQIVPLRIGGGTRLKIVESLAMGTPVVSTSIGAQGLGLRHEQEILLADSAAGFVREAARALRDAQLRQNLQRAGIETVCSRLSWQMIGKQLNVVYRKFFPGHARIADPKTR